MDEQARRVRNTQRLAELYPGFATRVAAIVAALERAGFRPRIQAAWRSIAAQHEAYERGTSRVKFGFHNVTGPGGEPEALAVDLLDDDFPLHPRKEYLLRLAAECARVRCRTGIAWGLPAKLRDAVAAAVATGQWDAAVKVGWDPTHVEPTDVTVAEARAGARPAALPRSLVTRKRTGSKTRKHRPR